MNEQTIILLFMVLFAGITILLYVWKAKKEISYKGDEGWQLIKNKANNVASYLTYVLIILLVIGGIILVFYDININIPLSRVFIYVLCLIGLRNTIEMFALIHFDKNKKQTYK